jgi:DNA-binding beta-propeller fold protein YncE
MKLLLALLALVVITPMPANAVSPVPSAIWGAPHPYGVAFDSKGTAYVAVYAPLHIEVFSPDGTMVDQWGAYGSDAGSITGPNQLAMDAADHLFVEEWSFNSPSVQSTLQEFATDGAFLKNIGRIASGPPPFPVGTFGGASGVAVDLTGRIFVTDTYAARTQVFANDGTYLYGFPSPGGDIALDAFGHVFEIEEGSPSGCGVHKYSPDGTELAHWGSFGSAPGQFNQPLGITVDKAGHVYVADTYNHRVQVFSNDGAFIEQWGGHGTAPGVFDRPSAIMAGPDGRIYVSDTWNNRIQVFGSLTTASKRSTWGALKTVFR